jgi:hypothetical protein
LKKNGSGEGFPCNPESFLTRPFPHGAQFVVFIHTPDRADSCRNRVTHDCSYRFLHVFVTGGNYHYIIDCRRTIGKPHRRSFKPGNGGAVLHLDLAARDQIGCSNVDLIAAAPAMKIRDKATVVFTVFGCKTGAIQINNYYLTHHCFVQQRVAAGWQASYLQNHPWLQNSLRFFTRIRERARREMGLFRLGGGPATPRHPLYLLGNPMIIRIYLSIPECRAPMRKVAGTVSRGPHGRSSEVRF